MKGVIRLNDPLENGGYVNKASGSKFMGIPVALQGILWFVFCTKVPSQYLILSQPGQWTAKASLWMAVGPHVVVQLKPHCQRRGQANEEMEDTKQESL